MPNVAYDKIASSIIDALEAAEARNWQLPWRNVDLGQQRNPETGTVYQGINQVVLTLVQVGRGYTSPNWLTFKGVQRLGGKLVDAKGKGIAIAFWRTFEREVDGKTETFPVLRYYTVFNADHVEGIHFPAVEAHSTEPSAILNWAQDAGASIEHGGNKAFYAPAVDAIQLPHRSQFHDDVRYASTLLHELVHWTGHKSRLDRFATKNQEGYAFEELVAEIGSVFLCAHHGIQYELEQHANYVKSWLRALRDDARVVFRAARLAQKAVEWVIAAADEGAATEKAA